MFHPVEKPKCSKYQRRTTFPGMDITMPIGGGNYAHGARQPNTNYAQQMHEWSCQESQINERQSREIWESKRKSNASIYQERKLSECSLKQRIRNKFEQKVQDYLDAVDLRREKLRDLFAKEEQTYVYETVEQAQKADDNKISEMKKRSEALKRAKEEERQEMVKQKRMQQYTERCTELIRPYLKQKLAMEAQNCNVQILRENEARRQMEKEIEHMWSEVMRKQDEAILERELQEAIIKYNRCKKDMDVLTMQIRAKKIAQAEHDALERENFRELQQRAEEHRQQEEVDARQKLEKSLRDVAELRKQVEIQKELDEQRQREEVALDEAFAKLGLLELEREKSKVTDNRATMKRELDMYRHHLEHLKKVREEEDKALDAVINACQAEAEAKHIAGICKHQVAMKKLENECYSEREQQIRLRKEAAQRELDCVKEENEMMRHIFEVNRKLHAEAERIRVAKALQYHDDLRQQIEFNFQLKKREMEDAEKRLQEGIEEEQRLEESIRRLIEENVISEKQHPFRSALEKFDCKCKN